jgi:thiol-disulfide isomerase/thioredoxin
VLIAIVVIGLTKAGGGGGATNPPDSLADAQKKLSGSPQPFAGLHAQANQLVGGGKAAFEQRLDELKGHPLVINKWASWCGPCQSEFSIFQDVATERGKQVGFLGLDVNDTDAHARGFLADRPLPFPSYTDPNEKLTAELKAPQKVAPVTVFVARDGRIATVHSGPYKSTEQLKADIDRYLG